MSSEEFAALLVIAGLLALLPGCDKQVIDTAELYCKQSGITIRCLHLPEARGMDYCLPAGEAVYCWEAKKE